MWAETRDRHHVPRPQTYTAQLLQRRVVTRLQAWHRSAQLPERRSILWPVGLWTEAWPRNYGLAQQRCQYSVVPPLQVIYNSGPVLVKLSNILVLQGLLNINWNFIVGEKKRKGPDLSLCKCRGNQRFNNFTVRRPLCVVTGSVICDKLESLNIFTKRRATMGLWNPQSHTSQDQKRRGFSTVQCNSCGSHRNNVVLTLGVGSCFLLTTISVFRGQTSFPAILSLFKP